MVSAQLLHFCGIWPQSRPAGQLPGQPIGLRAARQNTSKKANKKASKKASKKDSQQEGQQEGHSKQTSALSQVN